MTLRSRAMVATLALTALLRPGPARACSLCRCGDPTFNLVGSQVFAAEPWHLGLDLDRYAKDQASLEVPGALEEEVEGRLTLSLSRTFGGRLMVIGRLPFAERRITTAGEQETLSGLSNPELLAHYQLYSPRRGSWLSLSLGLLAPWGRHDGQVDGVRAEEHLQPSSGAAGVAPGLSFARLTGGRSGSLYGSVLARFNGRNDAGYHYGNAVLANLGYEHTLGGRLNGTLEVNFRHARKDEPAVGEEDPDTGGTMLYLTPRLLLRLQDAIFLRLGVQLPLVEDLYGTQDEHVNVQTGLTVRF